MKSGLIKMALWCLPAAVLFAGCSKNDNQEPDPDPVIEKYVVITMSENTLTKPGYATAFDSKPSGNISNIAAGTLQGMGMGGWRPYKNWLFKMFNTSANEKGIERLNVSAAGIVTSGDFLKTNNTINGSGNFVVQDETSGFYWDADKPFMIQRFNPTTLSRTGEWDFEADVKKTDEGINNQSIGQHFLAVKNGKLFADVHYGKNSGAQSGMFDDFFSGIYIAVIDIATGNYEKTIAYDNTGGIAYINDNEMYSFDTNGDLYLLTQGRSAVGGQSKLLRIKAAATDFDDWEINMDDIMTGGKFVSIFADNGKLYTTIPTAALTGGPTGNINFSEIWEFYVIDAATKARTKISGLPLVTNPGAAYGAQKLDDKIVFRVNAPTQNINGYYELNGTGATSLFNVTEGGSVSGIYKIEVDQ
ncbi:MAG TPA: hypothetical protein PLL71_16930 [Agriterribacter sp.]|nr:hypothetical protein [Agriterribacter sp.]